MWSTGNSAGGDATGVMCVESCLDALGTDGSWEERELRAAVNKAATFSFFVLVIEASLR